MKKVKGFKMRSICREHVVLPEDGSLVNFNKIISFNSSAAYLWEAVGDEEFSEEKLRDLLLEHYEIDEQTASTDAANIARSWKEVGIVSE